MHSFSACVNDPSNTNNAILPREENQGITQWWHAAAQALQTREPGRWRGLLGVIEHTLIVSSKLVPQHIIMKWRRFMHSITTTTTLWVPNSFSNAEEREPRSLGIMTVTSRHRVRAHEHDLR